jgi:hypothetical protein
MEHAFEKNMKNTLDFNEWIIVRINKVRVIPEVKYEDYIEGAGYNTAANKGEDGISSLYGGGI